MDAGEIRLMAEDPLNFPSGKLREALLIAARVAEAVANLKAAFTEEK